ncbi:MAG: RecX family transcriptional regulator [Chloroflexi bacterium]|nr:RecX family transcriptional regulator [Chloroflexota bacterium]
MAGQITALEGAPRGPREAARAARGIPPRVRVFIDGRYAFSVDPLLAATLQVGLALDDAALARLTAADECHRALDAALSFLAYRPRSVHEVRARLTQKGYSTASVEAAIERLQALGLLDDAAFARYWVEQRRQFRPRGAAALRAELRAKGVAPPTIAAALAETDERDETEAACRAGRARLRALVGLDAAAFRQRLGAYLQRRGFSYAASAAAVARLWAERQGAGASSAADLAG